MLRFCKTYPCWIRVQTNTKPSVYKNCKHT